MSFRTQLSKLAKVFPTEEALQDYLKEHPGANPKNHSVGEPKKKERLDTEERSKVVDKFSRSLGKKSDQIKKITRNLSPKVGESFLSGAGKILEKLVAGTRPPTGRVAGKKRDEAVALYEKDGYSEREIDNIAKQMAEVFIQTVQGTRSVLSLPPKIWKYHEIEDIAYNHVFDCLLKNAPKK